MAMKQLVRQGVLAAMATASVVCAQTPPDGASGDRAAAATRPASGGPRLDRGMRGDGMRGDGMRGDGMRGDGGPGGPGSGRRFRESPIATPEEWADAEPFMQANSPVRVEMLKKLEADLGPDRPIAQVVRGRLMQRFRDLERKRVENAGLYPFAVRQLQSEDAVMGTLRDGRAPNADAAAIEMRLDEQVRAFVSDNLSERQARIDQLKSFLDAQTRNLEKDRGAIDELVRSQREKFKKQMDAMLDYNAKADDAPPAATTTRPAKRPGA